MTYNLLADSNDSPTPPQSFQAELVGEGKKFKDVESLAKGKWESDVYIKQMEARMDELRNDYLKLREEATAGSKLQDLIDRLEKGQQHQGEQNPNANDGQNMPAIKPEQLESLVSEQYQKLRASEKQQENYNVVKEKLVERFGPNYKAAFQQQINDLGITEDYANELALKSPKVFLKTFGLDQAPNRENFQAPPRSDQRKDSFSPTGSAKRTWAYYQEMKKNNPKAYYDPKTLVQIVKDAEDLGEEFGDGDWDAWGRRKF